MATTRSELQVTWPTAANTASVAIDGSATSEVATFDTNGYGATIQLQANAAAAGDEVDFYVELAAATAPDGTGTAVYDTTRVFLGTIVGTLAATNYRLSATLPIADSCKIYAVDSTTNSGAVTVAATITEFISA